MVCVRLMVSGSRKVLIVVAEFYREITDMLVAGAQGVLEYADVEYDVIRVPGSYEIPAALVFAIMSTSKVYNGYVALGCVIRGDTDHYEYVCQSVSSRIGELSIQHAVPIGFGVITSPSYDMALIRASLDGENYGGRAANATVKLMDIYNEFIL